MPQLDTGTYFGQVTWLVRVFGVLYRTRTGDVLPKLNRIVKIRSKKRERTRGEARQYEGERKSVERGYGARRGGAAGKSYRLLQETQDVQSEWMNGAREKRSQEGERGSANGEYRKHRMNEKRRSERVIEKMGSEKGK